MADSKLFKVEIADRSYDDRTYVVSKADWSGERYYAHTDSHDYDCDRFTNARQAAVVELPEPERAPFNNNVWMPKGSDGKGIRITESQLDDLIAVGALAVAVKLQLAEIPTLAEDLAAVLGNARSVDPKLTAAVDRLRAAQTAKKITFTT